MIIMFDFFKKFRKTKTTKEVEISKPKPNKGYVPKPGDNKRWRYADNGIDKIEVSDKE